MTRSSIDPMTRFIIPWDASISHDHDDPAKVGPPVGRSNYRYYKRSTINSSCPGCSPASLSVIGLFVVVFTVVANVGVNVVAVVVGDVLAVSSRSLYSYTFLGKRKRVTNRKPNFNPLSLLFLLLFPVVVVVVEAKRNRSFRVALVTSNRRRPVPEEPVVVMVVPDRI